MKKFSLFFFYFCIFSCLGIAQVSENDHFNLVSSLESEFGFIDRVVRKEKTKKREGETNYIISSLRGASNRNFITIQFSDNQKLIKDRYRSQIIMPIPPVRYKEKLELFSKYAYFRNHLNDSPNSKATLFAYYENFFFHIQGDGDFIDKSILKICEDLSEIYKK